MLSTPYAFTEDSNVQLSWYAKKLNDFQISSLVSPEESSTNLSWYTVDCLHFTLNNL